MKKLLYLFIATVAVLCLLFLGKYFLKSKKVEFVFEKPQQEEPVAEAVKTGPNIEEKLVSWGFQKAESRKVDTIIVHTSYDSIGAAPYSVEGLIKEYKSYQVAPHYLIDRNGVIYELVEEKDIAYQAGKSQMPDGRQDVNGFSIGIELMNTKIGQITAEQYQALNDLIKDIKSRHEIKYVLGHNQIASDRKDDPWNLDWNRVKK